MIQIEKLEHVMRDLTREKGPFTLFGLFHREGAPYDKWDLVVSASWLEEGDVNALRELVEKLTAIADTSEMVSFSRVVPLSPDDPRVAAVLATHPVEDGRIVLRDVTLFEMDMAEAYILRAMRPPAPALSGTEGD